MRRAHDRVLDRSGRPDIGIRPGAAGVGSGLLDWAAYDYANGEIPPATNWVPSLLRNRVGSVAARDTDDRLVGYVLVVRLADHADAREAAPGLGVDLSSACYLAELGVSPQARGRGLETSLVMAALEQASPSTTAVAVRTAVDQHTAIRFYEGCGFHLVPGVRLTRRRREGLFLVRTIWGDDST